MMDCYLIFVSILLTEMINPFDKKQGKTYLLCIAYLKHIALLLERELLYFLLFSLLFLHKVHTALQVHFTFILFCLFYRCVHFVFCTSVILICFAKITSKFSIIANLFCHFQKEHCY